MSYDYNALVAQISSSRRKAVVAPSLDLKLPHLQESVEAFATLSGYCPMTPLLWMQYSRDMAEFLLALSGETSPSIATAASSQVTQLQLLELALAEFPGSAILHVYYLQILCQGDHDAFDKINTAMTSAFERVGRGSHRNEGALVAAIYRLAVDAYSNHGKLDKALATFVRRAQTPIKEANDSIMTEFQAFCEAHPDISAEKRQETIQAIDEARRYESRTFHALVDCEDEVDVAMHNESILPRHQVDLEQLPWDTILQSDDKTCWMGYGGILSADAFFRYAQTCSRYRIKLSNKKSDLTPEEQEQIRQDEGTVQQLAVCIYERAVAECPAVETIWLKYVRYLQYVAQGDQSLLPRLRSVVDRSVRNCPYSLQLNQQKLLLQGVLAEQGAAILDPDQLQKIVEDAIHTGFIPSKEACLELYMTAARVLRRRLMMLLAKASVVSVEKPTPIAYDEPESFIPGKYSFHFPELDDAAIEEVEDLCDDCRDFYETIDTFLKQNHASWSEGRWILLSERSFMEVHFLGPLSGSLGDHSTNMDGRLDNKFKETIQSYDKLIKVLQPTPPDTYTQYINIFQSSFPVSKPSSVISKFRQTRFLFQRALKTLGRPKNSTRPLDPVIQRDFDSGLRNLCHQYLVFERYFGSDKSLASTSAAVQKKISKLFPLERPEQSQSVPGGYQFPESMAVVEKVDEPMDIAAETTNKRTLEGEGDDEPSPKRNKTINAQSSLSTKPKQVHKVKVGNMEYPAHPFTVRVSNLVPGVDDMDLVDTFRPRCGAIVHAKIMREKHHHQGKGESKGWGVVQFELQEAVDAALALSDIIGICGKLVHVERSHIPAVTLVPAGMHRVKPAGEGRNSKLNLRKRQQKGERADDSGGAPKAGSVPGKEVACESASSSKSLGVLAFRPRGVQGKRNTPSKRPVLGDDEKNKSK